MNKKMTSLILMAALIAPGMSCWADSTNATGNNNDPLKHPVNAYTNHEVKEDMKDSQENSQKAADAKASYNQAKTDYEDSLKANGAESQNHQGREEAHAEGASRNAEVQQRNRGSE